MTEFCDGITSLHGIHDQDFTIRGPSVEQGSFNWGTLLGGNSQWIRDQVRGILTPDQGIEKAKNKFDYVVVTLVWAQGPN